jgi:excisionase family DNA binding protein
VAGEGKPFLVLLMIEPFLGRHRAQEGRSSFVASFNTLIKASGGIGMPAKIEPDAIYTAKEVAALFRCGMTNIYKLANDGDLAVIKAGVGTKSFRFQGSDLLAFLEERKEGGPSPSQSSYRHIGKFLAGR